MTDLKLPTPERLPSIREAEQAVLVVCDDWYDYANSDNVNTSEWHRICDRLDKAMQTLRRARAKAKGLPHDVPHQSNQG